MRTIDRFPYLYSRLDELPPTVADAIRTAHGDQPIFSLVLIPPQEHLRNRFSHTRYRFFDWADTPQRTLAFSETRIMMVESLEDTAKVTIIPLQNLLSIEIVTVLLYAHLEMVWAEGEHTRTLKLKFNAVGERLIRSQVDCIRPIVAPSVSSDVQPHPPMPDLDLKFKNYLRMALLPGEQLQAVVFQPAFFQAGHWRRRLLAPRRTVAITDRHVLFVEDDVNVHSEYGVVTRFVPLARIRQASVETGPDWTTLHIDLGITGHRHLISVPLAATNADVIADTLRKMGVCFTEAGQSPSSISSSITSATSVEQF